MRVLAVASGTSADELDVGVVDLAVGGGPLVTSDERGLPVDGKEVVMWALLGFLTWHGLPGATTATGATAQRMLGRISPGHEPLRMPQPVLVTPRRLRIVAEGATVGRFS